MRYTPASPCIKYRILSLVTTALMPEANALLAPRTSARRSRSIIACSTKWQACSRYVRLLPVDGSYERDGFCTYETLATGTSRSAILPWQTVLLLEGCCVQVNSILPVMGVKLMAALENWQQPPAASASSCHMHAHQNLPKQP